MMTNKVKYYNTNDTILILVENQLNNNDILILFIMDFTLDYYSIIK